MYGRAPSSQVPSSWATDVYPIRSGSAALQPEIHGAPAALLDISAPRSVATPALGGDPHDPARGGVVAARELGPGRQPTLRQHADELGRAALGDPRRADDHQIQAQAEPVVVR